MGENVWAFPKANPEFIHLSEREVWAALGAPENGPAVEAEVMRLVVSFFDRYTSYVEANGLQSLPPQMMHITTRCPIERVAVLIMVRYVLTTGESNPALRH